MLILRSSSTFTVPKGVKKIDVFCVGGGGSTNELAGGGGGYTTTKLGVNVDPGDQIPVTVGYIGIVDAAGLACGGTSSVGDICSANGGNVNSYAWYLTGCEYEFR